MNLGQNPFSALAVDLDDTSTCSSSSSCRSHGPKQNEENRSTKVLMDNTVENRSQPKTTISTPSANSSTNLCKYQRKLFSNLESLKHSSTKRTSCFVSKDVAFHGSIYRIYNYNNFPKYSDFNKPSGLECRGHMFEMDIDSKEPIRLACLPPEKFFNIDENPFTENLDFHNPKQIMIKEDGSLISTFLHNDGELHLKSKGSLESSQAIDSMAFLSRSVNSKFESELQILEQMGYTVNLEYVGPLNRVLLSYQDERLIPLSIRNRENGKYFDKDKLDPKTFPEVLNRWVKQLDVSNLDMDTFIQNYRYEKRIEGYVIQLASGQFCKAKTEYYLNLSHPREMKGKRLFMSVLNNQTDDVKGLWSRDTLLLDRVDKYENTVMKLLNESKQGIEHFYEENHWMVKHFDGDARKLRKRWYSNAKKAFREDWLLNIAMKRLEINLDPDQWNDELKKVWKQVEYKFLD